MSTGSEPDLKKIVLEDFETIEACRSCNSRELTTILALGETPLANALVKESSLQAHEKKIPLNLAFCNQCTLVQILETVNPEILFREYNYLSSCSETAVSQAAILAKRIVKTKQLNAQSLVVDIASNDGMLLKQYQNSNIPVLGIDPAENIVSVAEKQGIPMVKDFFSRVLADGLCQKDLHADIIHAHNVLAHVADLNGFIAGMASLIKPDGWIIIEVPYIKDLIQSTEFDTIYHEHLCYFSLNALKTLFERHALCIIDVEHLDIHGGSLRLNVLPQTTSLKPNESVDMMMLEEVRLGMAKRSYYRDFGEHVNVIHKNLVELLQRLKEDGKQIAAYGASAKGSTLLNTLNIDPELIDFVVDKNPLKQKCYTPGLHLPILAPEELLKRMPDYVLLLTWNFKEEILKQQDEYRKRGGRFILPIPDLEVV